MNNVVQDTILDLVTSFTFYDRKEDSELPIGEIEKLIQIGELSIDEIVNEFSTELRNQLKSQIITALIPKAK